MSYSIKAYLKPGYAKIVPLSVKRDWMGPLDTAYKCLPITSANTLGWGLYFEEDISFVWDGNLGNEFDDLFEKHVKVLNGQKYVQVNSGNKTIAFVTGLCLKTDEDLSIFVSPAPNEFIDNLIGYSSLFSTSFFQGEIQAVFKILRPNEIVYIKAGTYVASFLPVSLTKLNNSELEIFDIKNLNGSAHQSGNYGKVMSDLHKQKKWSNFYRNATDEKNNKLGKHEISNLKLKIIKRSKNV
jgi:Family of unknown function (DUF6065)